MLTTSYFAPLILRGAYDTPIIGTLCSQLLVLARRCRLCVFLVAAAATEAASAAATSLVAAACYG
jgi:hypothetical protein